jgi:hypothetical protein
LPRNSAGIWAYPGKATTRLAIRPKNTCRAAGPPFARVRDSLLQFAVSDPVTPIESTLSGIKILNSSDHTIIFANESPPGTERIQQQRACQRFESDARRSKFSARATLVRPPKAREHGPFTMNQGLAA